MADYYKKKYVHTSRSEYVGDGHGMVEEVTQAALLPSIKVHFAWLSCSQKCHVFF